VIVILIYHRNRPIELIKIDIGEIGWVGKNWIIMVQDRDK
jgi:hypothetical protein